MAKGKRASAAQPHDGLVKWTFTQQEHAVGLLKATLPKGLIAVTDWTTLRVEKGSFVDRALRSRHGDIVYSARVAGKEALFYVLVEHQSKVEPLMMFRIALYLCRLWEQLVQDRPARTSLPPILPLLLHHSAAGWTAATAFEELIDVDAAARPALDRYTPRFSMHLVDLSERHAGRIAERALTSLGKLVFWCLKVARDDERFTREIRRMRQVIVEAISAPNGHAALEVLMRYLVATHARLQARKISELLIEAAGPEAQEDIVDFVEKFRREFKREGRAEGRIEGRREGHAEGRREGQADVLLDQLAARFGEVPAAVQSRVRSADAKTLSTWALRILTAATLEEVLDAPSPDTTAPPHRKTERRPASTTTPKAPRRPRPHS